MPSRKKSRLSVKTLASRKLKIRRKNETIEQQTMRREKEKLRQQYVRAMETTPERELRLLKGRIAARARNANKTRYQNQLQRAKVFQDIALRHTNEAIEEKDKGGKEEDIDIHHFICTRFLDSSTEQDEIPEYSMCKIECTLLDDVSEGHD